MRVGFYQAFKLLPEGNLEPLRRIRVGAVEFGPGVTFSKGVAFAGVDFTQYIGHDLEVDDDNGTWILRGIY